MIHSFGAVSCVTTNKQIFKYGLMKFVQGFQVVIKIIITAFRCPLLIGEMYIYFCAHLSFCLFFRIMTFMPLKIPVNMTEALIRILQLLGMLASQALTVYYSLSHWSCIMAKYITHLFKSL